MLPFRLLNFIQANSLNDCRTDVKGTNGDHWRLQDFELADLPLSQ